MFWLVLCGPNGSCQPTRGCLHQIHCNSLPYLHGHLSHGGHVYTVPALPCADVKVVNPQSAEVLVSTQKWFLMKNFVLNITNIINNINIKTVICSSLTVTKLLTSSLVACAPSTQLFLDHKHHIIIYLLIIFCIIKLNLQSGVNGRKKAQYLNYFGVDE